MGQAKMAVTVQARLIEGLAGSRCHFGFEVVPCAKSRPDSKASVAMAISDLVSAKGIVEIDEAALSCSRLLGSVRVPVYLTQQWAP